MSRSDILKHFDNNSNPSSKNLSDICLKKKKIIQRVYETKKIDNSVISSMASPMKRIKTNTADHYSSNIIKRKQISVDSRNTGIYHSPISNQTTNIN